MIGVGFSAGKRATSGPCCRSTRVGSFSCRAFRPPMRWPFSQRIVWFAGAARPPPVCRNWRRAAAPVRCAWRTVLSVRWASVRISFVRCRWSSTSAVIYFDPTQPSDLEHLLATARIFRRRADAGATGARVHRRARHHQVQPRVPREPANWPSRRPGGGAGAGSGRGRRVDRARLYRGENQPRSAAGGAAGASGVLHRLQAASRT
jgi:hypothetical protein